MWLHGGYVAIWIAGALRTRVLQGQQQCHPLLFTSIETHSRTFARLHIVKETFFPENQLESQSKKTCETKNVELFEKPSNEHISENNDRPPAGK